MVKYNKYVILEIIQISIILFVMSMFVSFIMSNVFTKFDEFIIYQEYSDFVYTFIKIIEVLTQLIIITIAYFYLEKILYKIPSISGFVNSKYESYVTAKHAMHVVIIISLIELNNSIKDGFHFLAYKFTH